LKQYQMYINGEWVDSDNGEKITVYNPSNEEAISQVPSASLKQVKEAIDDAYAAQKDWKRVPAATRGSYLVRIAALIRKNADYLARTLSEE
ncbi:aldehyde dehydrogenase family protein, partial [Oenococcus oeni]